MSTERPATGIEVKFVLNEAQKQFGKIFHFFHLDFIGEAVYKASHVLISIDGVQSDQLLSEPHPIACSPGEHTLEVAVKNYEFSTESFAKYMNGTSLQVNVPEGTILQVSYIPSTIQLPTGHNARLELVAPAAR